MKILSGKQAQDFVQAALLVFQVEGMSDMSPEVAALFASGINARQVEPEARLEVNKEVRRQYGREASWNGELWCIPIPALRYDARALPSLMIECQAHLVAAGQINPGKGYKRFPVTVTGPFGKPFNFILPLLFLHAFLNDNLDSFQIVSRDSTQTCWEVAGIRDVKARLPNDFVDHLRLVLRRKPVADWVCDFGDQGRSLAPLVVGTLLGMHFGKATSTRQSAETYSCEALEERLKEMGYRTEEMKIMLSHAADALKPDMSLEEALRIVLQKENKEDI